MQKKTQKKPRIGLYSCGLRCYWSQFEGLRGRLVGYGTFMKETMEAMGAEVFYYEMVDAEDAGVARNNFV